MYIRRFLIVSYIVSFLIGIILIYGEKLNVSNDYNEEYIFEFYIPKIDLNRKVYNIGSSLNDVDYNVKLLEASNIEENIYFLASHSGGGGASYFDDLIYLEKGDIIWINNYNSRYAFVVDEMFYIQKTGYLEVLYNESNNVLYLITCSLKYFNKQLIIKSKLVYKC